ncbi:MAG: YbhB/YbcL family Raf kinase inhibitor-like protein [Burkholderiales bacterium]
MDRRGRSHLASANRALGGVLLALLIGSCAAQQPADEVPPGAFRISSPGLPDNGMLSRRNGGNNKAVPTCTGENISPPLAWSNAPAATRSYVVIVHDQAGRDGLGVLHWLAYGIPASVSGLGEGDANAPSGSFVGGKNVYGQGTWAGPCPVRGGAPQHYTFTIIATDLDPSALAPGLSLPEVLDAVKGHNLRAANMVLRYAQ